MAKLLSRMPVVVILGATGAGKSKLAIEIALKYNGEIISTDAMQVYKGLDIVTNKVTAAEQKLVPHHLIDYICPLKNNYTVVDFKKDALLQITDIFKRKKLPILVGGTNYYIEALLWQFLMETHKKEDNLSHTSIQLGIKKEDTSQNSVKISSKVDNESSNIETDKLTEDNHISTAKTTPFSSKNDVYKDLPTRELHDKLKIVDPSSGKRIHPHDRRKILRALEIYEEHGVPMSELLAKQHSEEGASNVSGPLRYPDSCFIWVQCQQKVLDERINKRVDQMMEKGLISELEQFHGQYNQQRLEEQGEADYTQGIYQSIGFKEFHEYLLLTAENRATDKGQKLLQQGIEDMKRVTRKYSKTQRKWIVGRFLKRRGKNVPPVYGVDSSEVKNWDTSAFQPASDIVQSFLNGDTPRQAAIPTEENDNLIVHNVCDVCEGKVFVTSNQWRDHLAGRKHKNNLYRKRKLQQEENDSDSNDPTVAKCSKIEDENDTDTTVPKCSKIEDGVTDTTVPKCSKTEDDVIDTTVSKCSKTEDDCQVEATT